MFDVGFWELSLIFVVLLVVVGPERLPGLARKAGLWLGKARRMIAEVKSEVDRELQMEDIKRSIKQQTDLDELRNLVKEVRSVESDVKATLDKKALRRSKSADDSKTEHALDTQTDAGLQSSSNLSQEQVPKTLLDAPSNPDTLAKRDGGV